MVLLMVAASGTSVSISSSLYACRTLESSSHAILSSRLRIPSRRVPSRRMRIVMRTLFFNIRVFQKCCERSRVSRGILEKKSIKLIFSRVRRRRREDEFLLIWKLRFQLRKFTFKEGTNEISRVFHRVVARISSFSLATFYLVTSMLLDEIFHTRNERYFFFFNSPLFQEGQKSIRNTMTLFIPFYEGEYKNFIRNASKSFSISKFNERKI